jgi:hypothetical protein
VDGAGDQLLARSRFARDENGGVGPGHVLDLAQDAPDGVAAADDLAEVALQLCLVTQVDVLVLEPVFRQPKSDDSQDDIRLRLIADGDPTLARIRSDRGAL